MDSSRTNIPNPKESAKFIASKAKHITIRDEGISKLGDKMIDSANKGELSLERFLQSSFHPSEKHENAPNWIFVADVLNFSFWKEEKVGWVVDGQTGYFALCAALKRAEKEGVDITNPEFFSKITRKDADKIFRSDSPVQIPLMEERIQCLREAGSVLIAKYNGSFANCIKKAEKSAVKLMKIIVEDFASFRDEATFAGQPVSFYKRAQILVADIWTCFKGKTLGEFADIDAITMFADYRVPQPLIYFGALKYDDALNAVLQRHELLPAGSEMEVEIRGCSIEAVELVIDYVKKKHASTGINAILVDYFLWDFRRKNAKMIEELKIPFHRTRGIFY